MELVNLSPFCAGQLVLPDARGEETLLVIVKATYDLRGGGVRVHEEQEPLWLADEYHGEPGESSLRQASDAVLEKPGTDVVLTGSAYTTPRDRYHVDVRLRVGRLNKWVRVFGDRHWKADLGMHVAGPPEPFERLPLTWERAFGGTDRSREEQVEAEPRNPVGVGFRGAKSRLPVEGTPLPNLEDPARPIGAPNDRPAPAGFSFICPNWEPRVQYVGTYDEAWQAQRAPLLPADFDARFHQVAPPDQVFPGELEPGTPVEVQNATPSGYLSFALPAPVLEVAVKLGGERHALRMRRDTVVIDGDAERLMLVWRGTVPVHGRVYDVEWIKVAVTGGLP